MSTISRAAAIAALAIAALASPASAAINPTSYHHHEVYGDFTGPGGTAGGYISCPANMRAVASGAKPPGNYDVFKAGLTTFDGRGAFFVAAGGSGQLRMSARCVPAAQLQSSTLSYRTIRVHQGWPNIPFALAPCPEGTLAYGGGGFYTRTGGDPIGGGSVYASMPEGNGTRWFFGATAPYLSDQELWVSAHCLPRSEFGSIVENTSHHSGPSVITSAGGYPVLSATANCPSGYAAYAGGAYLHRSGSTAPAVVGYLTASTMTDDDRGWYARAWTSQANATLTTTVQCMST